MKRPRNQNKDKKRLDIRDVAKHAGVSIATVSRTMNAIPTVDKELAARVHRSISELNYFPNTQARALVSGRSRLLGLVISEITNPYFPELIRGFEDIAVANNYELLIGSTNYDPKLMETCVRRMLERHVEGVAIITFGFEAPLLEQLIARNIPMVFVDTPVSGMRAKALLVDYRTGIRQGVEHLHGLGHRSVAYITGPMLQRTCQLRLDAFEEAMKEFGMAMRKEWVHEGDHMPTGGIQAMEKFIQLKQRPTAVMCSNDMMAMGVLRSCAAMGVRVPKDFSVLGFDDIQLAEFVSPPLTSIRMSRTDIAKGAFNVLRAYIESPETAERQALGIPTRLVVRESTGSVPKSAPPQREKAELAAMLK